MKRPHLAREIVEIVAITLVLFLVIHFTTQAYQVNDDSMQNGLHSGQNVLVNRVAYLFHSPQRGDVVVLRDPTNTNHTLLRRIIGVPGDNITLDGNSVTVDGVQLNEPYVSQEFNPSAIVETVPAGSYFVLADNRLNISDSRDFGTISGDMIVGQAVMVYWPLNQWSFINTYKSTYSSLK